MQRKHGRSAAGAVGGVSVQHPPTSRQACTWSIAKASSMVRPARWAASSGGDIC